MDQTHTEQSIEKNQGLQNTGNHKKPDAPDARGADRFGGTRTGAENVESGTATPPKGGDSAAV